jgi:hypothetical protein
MEMRTQKSSNPVVKLLIKIKEFNDENSLIFTKKPLKALSFAFFESLEIFTN